MPQPTLCEKCGSLLSEGMSSAECVRCSPPATVDIDRVVDADVSYLYFERPPPSGGVDTCDDEAKSTGKARLPELNSFVGNYQIIRRLGQGGMGAAFEAEQVDNGRRVALKFIAKSGGSAESEQRVQQSFLQEGQLAAGINHPHSVYVYATEVLDGQLVISMELVRGISLQEYVEQRGPLPVKVAIEIILQVIAGLAEANRHGILHRDIKPSNCFIADGVVKVGDYGLAVHFDAGRRYVLPAGFAGTFCYASPEQWQVEQLDVRSDVYGVGGTLHFLLTGQPPFTEQDLAKLRQLVLDTRPPSAQAIRAEIPVDLARIVLRCLEKRPADRFQNYEELQAALRPFGPEVWPAAHPLSRVVAIILDQFPIFAINFAIVLSIMSFRVDPADFWKAHPLLELCYCLKDVLFYGIPEGLWGMTPGKWLMGIRVVNRDRNPPGILRACLRATIFAVVPSIPLWIAFALEPQNEHDIFKRAWLGLASLIIVLLLFTSMRARNGFAAWHDLLSGTRVQLPPPASGRVAIPVTVDERMTPESGELGPYAITHTLDASADYEWLLGYDEILRRPVWLRRVSAASPALPPAACSVSRGGRLRWLAGRRTEVEHWDAFEAVSGQPLVSLLGEPQSWQRVRFWLFDLAGELALARQENTLPAHLGLNRVWITSTGHAKLLDVPAPGFSYEEVASELCADGPNALCRFLNQVAVSSLNGQAYPAEVAATTTVEQPMPLHALPIVASLRTSDSLDSIGRQLSSVLTKPTEVTRRRRAALVLSCLLLPIISAAALLAFSLTLAVWERKMPELKELRACLVRYEPGPGFPQSQVIQDDEDRAHLETYIVGNFKSTITNPGVWHSPYSHLLIPPAQRDAATRLVKTKTEPSAAELAVAERQILPQLSAQTLKSDVHFLPSVGLRLLTVLAVFIAVPALLLTGIFGVGPMQTMLGIGYVTRRGQAAGRLRLLWRASLAWSPVFLSLLLILLANNNVDLGLSVGISFGVMLALAVISVLLPQRGIAERLAGVWVVRR